MPTLDSSSRAASARVREAAKRVLRGDARGLSSDSPDIISVLRSINTRSTPLVSSSQPSPITSKLYSKIDKVTQSLVDNDLTLLELVQNTCSYNYWHCRFLADPKFQASIDELRSAEQVRSWAFDFVREELIHEAKSMQTKSLQTGSDTTTVEWLASWSPTRVYQVMQEHTPRLVSLLESLLVGAAQEENSVSDSTQMSVSVIGSILWKNRSQKTNYFGKAFTVYLYATGVHSATINVLNRLGLSESYGTLRNSLITLSKSCTRIFRGVAAECRSFLMWDNINLVSNVAEQRIKNSGSFDSGTASTLVELHPAPGCTPESIDNALDLNNYLVAIKDASDLVLEDLHITEDDEAHLRKEFAFEAMANLIEYGGADFQRFQNSHNSSRPLQKPLLEPRTTKAYPLPTLHLEQASGQGNAIVVQELLRITRMEQSPLFKRRLTIITGDLLTVNRILSVRDVRTLYMRTPVHVKDNHENFSYLVPFAGLFHTRMTAATAILQAHYGKPNAQPKDSPASLWRHNEVLKRKHITPAGKVAYRVCQDLIFHSLIARLLDVIRISSGNDSLDALGSQLRPLSDEIAWKQLHNLVLSTVTDFTTPETAGNDDVLRNSILFIRDSLLLRCFVSAIKCGNISSVVLILKTWAMAFRGAGRKQYALELLRFRHNIVHAWPASLRDLILSNLLVNMTGKHNSWKETDLLQEHMNYWIKIVYKARGSNASWSWLEEISPCITTLRKLANNVNKTLAPPNSSHHTTPALDKDIHILLKQLIEDKVHTIDQTRQRPEAALRAPDVLALGYQQLAEFGPSSVLGKFNETRFGSRCLNHQVRPSTPFAANEGHESQETQQDEGDHIGLASNTSGNMGERLEPQGVAGGPIMGAGDTGFEVVLEDEESGEPFGISDT